MSETTEPQRTRAEDNPWYRLATLFGEAPEELRTADGGEITSRNRIAWNRWVATGLTQEQRERLLKIGFPSQELTPLAVGEQREILAQFLTRSGHENQTAPDPKQVPNFNSTHFEHPAYFDGFLFPHMSNFGSAIFAKEAHFHGAIFAGDILFRATTFVGFADFGEAYFTSATRFDQATFATTTVFTGATFSNWVTFYLARFDGEAQFIATKFQQSASFQTATLAIALFRNAEFADLTRFVNAHFVGEVPDFRGAKLHEATEWHKVTWPLVPADEVEARKQLYAYERLKQEMERLKKHEDEQTFFRKELHIRRMLAPRVSMARFSSYAYAVLSDYGQSASRPLYWLFGMFVVGSLVFAFTPITTAGTEMTLLHAASLNFSHIFAVLPIHSQISPKDTFSCLSKLGKLIVIGESIVGPLLLFLIGLAWRNQFRMR